MGLACMKDDSKVFTLSFGRLRTVLCLKGITFIIGVRTLLVPMQITWNRCLSGSTADNT